MVGGEKDLERKRGGKYRNKMDKQNKGHVGGSRESVSGRSIGKDLVERTAYQLLPSIFTPEVSACRRSCAALNCSLDMSVWWIAGCKVPKDG